MITEIETDRLGGGPIVLHQWPLATAAPDPDHISSSLFDFSQISEYIIPRQDVCQQPVAVCTNGYRILGHPVCLEDTEKYTRNEFIFNFCLVIREDEECSAYEKAVNRIARVLTDAEEQEDLLLGDEKGFEPPKNKEAGASDSRVPKLRMLCENVYEDLNNYGECVIRLSDAHELNLKLFASIPPVPSAKPFHVPFGIVDLSDAVNGLWDMTMQRITPYVDGINHIARIAELASVDTTLVQQAVHQFLRFRLVVLLDMFQYGATYAPTPEIGRLLFDEALQEDCAEHASISTASTSTGLIVNAYTKLSHGVTLKAWIVQDQSILQYIDVRRFITIGLLRGIIYRVHWYATKDANAQSTAATSSQDRQLDRYLDGSHCFDEICVALSMSPQELLSRLRSRKDVHVFER
ncbi:MAG: hypothetical protein Q9162_007669 [Coniocarpon cinnabarinum]